MSALLLKHFTVQEFVPRHIYQRRGDKAIELMDYRIVKSIDDLRANLKTAGYDSPLTINNWIWGGDRQFCGLRTPTSKDYSETSQHTFGRAIDAVSKTSVAAMHHHILTKRHLYPHINFIEIDINWLHIDCRDNVGGNDLVLWSPKRGFVDRTEYLKEL